MKIKVNRRLLRFTAPVVFLLTGAILYFLQADMFTRMPISCCIIGYEESIGWDLIFFFEWYAKLCGSLFLLSIPVAVLWKRKHVLMKVFRALIGFAAFADVVTFSSLILYAVPWYYEQFPYVMR